MSDQSFTVFIDGDCPLCRREAGMLRRMDRGRGRLKLANFNDPDFDAAELGISHETLMAEIHGQTHDGRVVVGMEVFRRAYAAVGWGWLVAPTGWPVLRPIFDALYRLFARNRLRLTGRRCESGACAIPARPASSTGDQPR